MNIKLELREPDRIADYFLEDEIDGFAQLLYFDEKFYWRSEGYPYPSFDVISEVELSQICLKYMTDRYNKNRLDRPPKSKDVGEVINIIRLKRLHTEKAPFWLESKYCFGEKRPIFGLPSLENVILCKNIGINYLTKSTDELHPLFIFMLDHINAEYNPEKGHPKEFLQFLKSIWPEDEQSIQTLQEIFGLFLTDITKFQKAFMLIGPKRSGKGTIIRTLETLLGHKSVANPTIQSLSSHFGLANLINKKAAIITDARISHKTDLSAATEAILRITGQDSVSIPRKYQSEWTGKLATRILLCSNEVPILTDSSSALASRFIMLKMTHSFFNSEDTTLFDRISTEMDEILNWSLDGLTRLLERGHFIQPESGVELVDQINDLSSPIDSFIKECCILDSSNKIRVSYLFEAYKRWSSENNNYNFGTVQLFGRNLYAATHKIRTQQLTERGKKHRFYIGIDLKTEFKDIFENA